MLTQLHGLAEALGAQASGQTVTPEALDDRLATLPLAIGADGVMVPFRPTPKTPTGAIQWREVKVGILARLGTRVTRAGKTVPQLLRRLLVAVLGTIDDFIPPLQLEATRQGWTPPHGSSGSVMVDEGSGASTAPVLRPL